MLLRFLKSLHCCITGNLYNREVHIDGEQVAIQVQDTPGVEVSNVMRDTIDEHLFFSLCDCMSHLLRLHTAYLSHAASSRVRRVERAHTFAFVF